jgi:hypothetical protein
LVVSFCGRRLALVDDVIEGRDTYRKTYRFDGLLAHYHRLGYGAGVSRSLKAVTFYLWERLSVLDLQCQCFGARA